MLKQAIERGLHHPRRACDLPRILDLAQNLRFAQNQRIQPGSHPEQVLGGRSASVLVQVAIEPRTQLMVADRKSVVEGKSGSVRVDLGGRRIIKKKKIHEKRRINQQL